MDIALLSLNHSAMTFDNDDMCSDSEFSNMKESVIEWRLSDQDSDDMMAIIHRRPRMT